MQVYKIIPTRDYTYGCALVVANSIEQAIKLYCSSEWNEYAYIEYVCTCNIIPKLDYDTTNPAILLDTIQSE